MVTYTKEEVAKHTTKDDCWVICSDKVYDVSKMLKDHPGTPELILENAGKDVTKILDGHSQVARDWLQEYHIGHLGDWKTELKSWSKSWSKKLILIYSDQ